MTRVLEETAVRMLFPCVPTEKITGYGRVTATAKLHYYIEPQGTGVNGFIYPRFEISHIHLFALIVARPFTVVR